MISSQLTVGQTTVAFSKDQYLVDKLNEIGFKKIVSNNLQKRFSQNELIKFLSKCDIAIIGLDQITNEVLSRVPKLKVISKFGVGLDNIDFEACKKNNVEVLHTQGVNKRSVSELALGYMLSLSRNIYTSSNDLKKGKWIKNGGAQISEKVIGIIGVGNIGKDLIKLLKPYGCKIIVNDIINQKKYYKKNNLIKKSKREIFKNADIITIHTPITKKLKHFINKEALKLMKPSTILINTARGGLINQEDLKWALKKNIISSAAIDVYEIEPPNDKELVSIPNLITTPHIGGSTKEAIRSMGLAAIENIKFWLKK